MSKDQTPGLERRFTKNNKLTQWVSHILASILMSHKSSSKLVKILSMGILKFLWPSYVTSKLTSLCSHILRTSSCHLLVTLVIGHGRNVLVYHTLQAMLACGTEPLSAERLPHLKVGCRLWGTMPKHFSVKRPSHIESVASGGGHQYWCTFKSERSSPMLTCLVQKFHHT